MNKHKVIPLNLCNNSLLKNNGLKSRGRKPKVINNFDLIANLIRLNQKIKSQYSKNMICSAPNTRKSRQFFTIDEDEKIKELVKIYGTKNWNEVSFFMKNRTPKQCRDRYQNYLNPTIFQGEWTKEEDEILFNVYNEIGPKWSVIKEKLPNRSSNAIKNRWNYFLHKKNEINNLFKDYDSQNEENNELFSSFIYNSDIESYDSDIYNLDIQRNDDMYNWYNFIED